MLLQKGSIQQVFWIIKGTFQNSIVQTDALVEDGEKSSHVKHFTQGSPVSSQWFSLFAVDLYVAQGLYSNTPSNRFLYVTVTA